MPQVGYHVTPAVKGSNDPSARNDRRRLLTRTIILAAQWLCANSKNNSSGPSRVTVHTADLQRVVKQAASINDWHPQLPLSKSTTYAC